MTSPLNKRLAVNPVELHHALYAPGGRFVLDKSLYEKFGDEWANYRKQYLRAKLIFPSIYLAAGLLGLRNVTETATAMNMSPVAFIGAKLLGNLLSGLYLSEYLYPYALTPGGRVLNRALASGTLAGMMQLISNLMGGPTLGLNIFAGGSGDAAKSPFANVFPTALSHMAFAPASGLFLDWLQYGPKLTPTPSMTPGVQMMYGLI